MFASRSYYGLALLCIVILCVATAASYGPTLQFTDSYDWIMEEHESTIVIGHEEDPEDRFFGDLADVLVHDDQIYTLDRDKYQLAVDAMTGERVYESGTRGQGPGEFMAPSRLFTTPDGRVGVLEGNGRQSFFTTQAHASGAFDFNKAERLLSSTMVSDICFSGETVYAYLRPLYASDDEDIQHVLIRKAPPYDTPDHFGKMPDYLDDFDPMFHSVMIAGHLHCMEDGWVIADHMYLNEMDVYKDGLHQRTISFPDVTPTELSVKTIDGGPHVGIGAPGTHALASMITLEGDDILVQYAYRPADWNPPR